VVREFADLTTMIGEVHHQELAPEPLKYEHVLIILRLRGRLVKHPA